MADNSDPLQGGTSLPDKGYLPRLGVLAYLTFLPVCIAVCLALSLSNTYSRMALLLLRLWDHAARYFPTDLIKTADLDPDGRYIFVFAPHGVASVSVWVTFDSEATSFAQKFPGIDVHPLTLEVNFRIPFAREFLLMHGVCDASRTACKRILTKGAGSAILLAVGGAQESLLTEPDAMDLVLAKRKGFVRIALETGASLVPVIGFGENELYDTYIPPQGSRGHSVQRWLLRNLGFTMPLFIGIGFFSGWGLMPKHVPLNVVVGKPLKVPLWKGDKGTPEHVRAVEEVHASYMAALKGLFNDHKGRLAKGRRRSLCIVQ